MMLDVEIKYCSDNWDKFLDLYEGRYLLIHGKELIGVYDSHARAYEEARKQFKVGTFLIEHCQYPQ